MKRIPSLDGFRAISITLVILAHCRVSEGFPSQFSDYVRHGQIGVTVFFVISGFLITTLLLSEEAKNGDISVRNFYTRRAIRILPVFFVYVLFVSVWQAYENIGITKIDIIRSLTFTFNFAGVKRSWLLLHFWTLSVEEQFYIIWPTLLILFRKDIKFVIYLSVFYSCVSRVIAYKFPAYAGITLAPYFQFSDSIIIGAFGAVLLFENPQIINLQVFRSLLLKIIALGIVASFVYFIGYGKMAIIALPFGNLMISASILFLVFCYLKPSDTFIYKFLNNKVIVHIGMLSYSLYVWQQFFIGEIPHLWRPFPYNLVMIYCAALVSYYLLEQPVLKLKKLFISKRSTADNAQILQPIPVAQTSRLMAEQSKVQIND